MTHLNIRKIAYLFFLLIGLSLSFLTACKKKDQAAPTLQTDSVTDFDGNVYKTVKIGTQWWMSQNLQVKHYRNGLSIKEIDNNNSSLWDSSYTKGAFCMFGYGESGTTMGDTIGTKSIRMGLLYNWYSINDTSNIAPKGWHVATENDWQQLESYLGMSSTDVLSMGWRGTNQANKMRFKNYGWNLSDNMFLVYGTNESGFSALGSGCRITYNINNGLSMWGDFQSPGYNAYWWTATQHPDSTKCSWYRSLNYNKATVFRYYVRKSYGLSIRCVKD